jgi:ABC-2 type transport system ATP-binding protein
MPQPDPVIETLDLSKTYRRFVALHELSMRIPQGGVFALLGANGAGKTTVIKVLLNMISPTRGSATILGVDSRAIGPTILAKVGYVSENQALPLRLRVDDFFAYLRPCYAHWDRNFEDELRGQFCLPPKRKIGELSHGMRMKMTLACALPFRPKVLISSHELDEVERFATHVGFLHEGRLLFQGSVGALAEHARSLFENGSRNSAVRPSLRDIFVAMVRAAKQRAQQPIMQ